MPRLVNGREAAPTYSNLVGFIFIFNLIVGTGALTLPGVFAKAGWMLSLIVIVLLAIISYMTVTFIIEAMACANAIRNWQTLQALRQSRSSAESSENDDNADEVSLASGTDQVGDFERVPLTIQNREFHYYQLSHKFELGEMASLFFNEFGRTMFYLCLIVYLYGDLSIYSAAVARSLRDVVCDQTNGTDANNLMYWPGDFMNNTSRPCWREHTISRLSMYRVFLIGFTLIFGPFAAFNVQKTKYLQMLTAAFRWMENKMSLSLDSNKTGHRKMDMKLENYPTCAVEALTRLETLIASRNKQNMVMQIISEYIFLERNAKDGPLKSQALPISQMNLFQEFQLIIALIEYFSRPGRDATRNAIFLSLFGSHLTPQRSKLLSRLISTAVSGSVAPLLSSAGTWMQQVGCKTPLSLDVAQNIVSDFISYSRKTPEQLKQLPMVGPHFAANFMVAVADLYLNEQRSHVLTPPPDALLDTITEWMTENPTLCQASQQPLILPAGAIAMPFATPLAGLLRWVVLAPLVSNRPAYSNLHLSLLRTLQQLVSSGESTALPIQDLMQIVQSLQNYCARLSESKTDPATDAAYQKCMERFAQAVQIALSSNCITNQIQLLCLLESLPSHKLMQIVIAAHKK